MPWVSSDIMYKTLGGKRVTSIYSLLTNVGSGLTTIISRIETCSSLIDLFWLPLINQRLTLDLPSEWTDENKLEYGVEYSYVGLLPLS